MPWHGVEWAIPLYQLTMLVLPVYCFMALRRRVARGLAKYRALRRYILTVIVPVILYTLLYVGLAVLEQLTKATLIPGEMARSFFILIGLGIAIWLVGSIAFAITLLYGKSAQAPGPARLGKRRTS
jgi:hypothetical protein